MNKEFDFFKLLDGFRDFYAQSEEATPHVFALYVQLLRDANQDYYREIAINIALDCKKYKISPKLLRAALRLLHQEGFVEYQAGVNSSFVARCRVLNRKNDQETETNEPQTVDTKTGEIFEAKTLIPSTEAENLDGVWNAIEEVKETLTTRFEGMFSKMEAMLTTLAAAPKAEKEVSKKDLVLIPDLTKFLENIVYVSDYSNSAKQKAKTRLEFLQQAMKTDCFAENWEAYAKMRHKMKKVDGKEMHLTYESAMLLVQKMIESKESAMRICNELEQATASQWRNIFYSKENKSATPKFDTYAVATDEERRANGENLLPF
jgi:hypothetical protein